ncbi:hypothetical protein [Legionella genomosp. 1]|uniref:hypothetical protein n=1 Tax=Legionella genomosp. 1 TaxID=1093625 RepID=UPI00105619CB|nr:hypothetical protein [Legionella genomosp. 1]
MISPLKIELVKHFEAIKQQYRYEQARSCKQFLRYIKQEPERDDFLFLCKALIGAYKLEDSKIVSAFKKQIVLTIINYLLGSAMAINTSCLAVRLLLGASPLGLSFSFLISALINCATSQLIYDLEKDLARGKQWTPAKIGRRLLTLPGKFASMDDFLIMAKQVLKNTENVLDGHLHHFLDQWNRRQYKTFFDRPDLAKSVDIYLPEPASASLS